MKNSLHVFEVKGLRSWLENCDQEDLRIFIKSDAVVQLIYHLKVCERLARTNKNFGIQLEILRIIEIVVKNEEGLSKLMFV